MCAATCDPVIDAQVEAAAEAAGAWVNRADQPDGGRVAFAAGFDRDAVHVSVSTGGTSPLLAVWLRDPPAAPVPPEVGALAALVAAVPRHNGRRRHADLPLDDALRALQDGDPERARALLAGTRS